MLALASFENLVGWHCINLMRQLSVSWRSGAGEEVKDERLFFIINLAMIPVEGYLNQFSVEHFAFRTMMAWRLVILRVSMIICFWPANYIRRCCCFYSITLAFIMLLMHSKCRWSAVRRVFVGSWLGVSTVRHPNIIKPFAIIGGSPSFSYF